jgi:hypothetical protein
MGCHCPQLKLRGIEVGEGTMDDPEMLTIIMDAREAIEATSSHDELGGFATIFQQQAGNCIKVAPPPGNTTKYENNNLNTVASIF